MFPQACCVPYDALRHLCGSLAACALAQGHAREGEKVEGASKPQLTLLYDISGAFRPGRLTCLMGVSGPARPPSWTCSQAARQVALTPLEIVYSGFDKPAAHAP